MHGGKTLRFKLIQDNVLKCENCKMQYSKKLHVSTAVLITNRSRNNSKENQLNQKPNHDLCQMLRPNMVFQVYLWNPSYSQCIVKIGQKQEVI